MDSPYRFETCPYCWGRGKIIGSTTSATYSIHPSLYIQCGHCQGSGQVLVRSSEDDYEE